VVAAEGTAAAQEVSMVCARRHVWAVGLVALALTLALAPAAVAAAPGGATTGVRASTPSVLVFAWDLFVRLLGFDLVGGEKHGAASDPYGLDDAGAADPGSATETQAAPGTGGIGAVIDPFG
jgi:hypothetical protein